jgi:hypothetical protein
MDCKKYFIFYFLIGIIVLIGLAGTAVAQSGYCSYSENRTFYVTTDLALNTTQTVQNSGEPSNWLPQVAFQLEQTTYFPTYLYWQCNNYGNDRTAVQFYTYDQYGSCSVFNEWATNIAFNGKIVDTETGNTVGYWSYFKNPDYSKMYITWLEYNYGKTYRFEQEGCYAHTFYCELGDCGQWMTLYSDALIYDPLPPLLNNFHIMHVNWNGWWTSTNILGGHYKLGSYDDTFNCFFFMQYMILYNITNFNITYYNSSNMLNIKFNTNFDGYVIIKGATKDLKFNFSKTIDFNVWTKYIGNIIEIYDTTDKQVYKYDISQFLNCLGQPESDVYYIKLKDLAGNQINRFKIVYQGEIYTNNNNGTVTVPPLIGADVTIIPLDRQDLAFNTTITTSTSFTWITAPFYIYTVQLVVRQIPIIGTELPAAFNVKIQGQEYADKQNLTNANYTFEITAYDNYTVQLLPGNYQINFGTILYFPSMIVRTNTYNLSLFDNNYYRKIIWRVGLLSDSFNETILSNPLLSVTVIDQNYKPVKNAEIQVIDAQNNSVGIKITDNNGNAQFAVMNGVDYTIKVFVANNLKATRTISFPANETVVQVTIQISLTQQEQQALTEQPSQPGQNATVPSPQEAQNQITNILTMVLTNYAIWAFVFIIIFASYAAKMAGTEIGILVAIVGIAVFTFLVPWLPVQIIALIGVVAGIMFGLRLVRRSQ